MNPSSYFKGRPTSEVSKKGTEITCRNTKAGSSRKRGVLAQQPTSNMSKFVCLAILAQPTQSPKLFCAMCTVHLLGWHF